MTIKLRIDNFDSIPDGGPIEFSASARSFEIGREQHLDWTLPDSDRVISGRHCEVRFENGGYWLYDVSRNGTFLNGAGSRVKSPYRLADGDRLQIGHYVLAVSLQPDAAGGEASPFPEPPASSDSIWDTGSPAPPPISRRDLMPPQRRGSRAADFSEQFLELPPIRAEAERTPAAESPFGPGGEVPLPPTGAMPRPQHPGAPPANAAPAAPFFGDVEPFAPDRPRPTPMEPMPRASLEPPAAAVADGSLLARIASGAGIPADVFRDRDPGDIADEIGAVLRITVEELTQLLKARAAAKTLAKSGNRTMISAVDNNPLKFIPLPQEAIEIMFARRRAGYLDARRSIKDSFDDIKTHELATYSAMQKALHRLLEDLSPEAIEKKVSGSAFASRKSRAWDTFVTNWEAKAESNDNGMLDVFLTYFADAYEKASKPK